MEMRNSTSPFSGVDVFCHVTVTIQFLEHPRILILVYAFCESDSGFLKVNQLVGNATQGCVLNSLNHRWQGAWENLGRHLEQFSPPTVWDITPEQAGNSLEVTQHLTKGCLAYVKETKLVLYWVLTCAF